MKALDLKGAAMATRREVIAAAGGVMLTAAGGGALARGQEQEDVCDFVDPFIGTGGHGHTFPGATTPFGMVQLSPDTSTHGWDSCSGYHQQDGSILGFSHTHLSGTGCADLLDVLVTPATGPLRLQPGTVEETAGSYRSGYDRKTETASPGYYRVRLTDTRITAELTATARVGVHRYTFPSGEPGHLLIDLAHGQGGWGSDKRPAEVRDARLRLMGDDILLGERRVFEWASGRVLYFALQVSRPFDAADCYVDDSPVAGRTVSGERLKAVLRFGDAGGAPLIVKVALSPVSGEAALANLRAEAPGWDFDRVRAEARAAWSSVLGKVKIGGAQQDAKTIFYTALYHCFLAPTLFGDVDGGYRGMDQKVHVRPPGRNNYSTYSLWDTYRTLHPLLTLVAEERVSDIVGGLVHMARESPRGPAVWPLHGVETGMMNGWHSAVVLAEAHAKGIDGIDYVEAWKLYRKRAFDDDILGLEWYKRIGFAPVDQVAEGASRTLEYAYDDWAMAALADAAGAHEDAQRLRERSRNYQNLFDRDMGLIRPRYADGTWVTPFEPRALKHLRRWNDFTEANAWQATFIPQHDLYAYMELFGGSQAFEAKLDTLFSMSSAMPPGSPPDIAGLVGQYAHGNEPCHHVAYLYAYTGAHHKTQARVRMLLQSQYKATPDGLAGNEDCGQMSAWYVMSALGLYPVDPVSAIYVFGSPLHERAEILLGKGRRLVIAAPGNGPDRPYIQSVRWNGRPWTRSWIAHAQLMRGGRLEFQMGPSPNLAFGADRADRPPSGLTP